MADGKLEVHLASRAGRDNDEIPTAIPTFSTKPFILGFLIFDDLTAGSFNVSSLILDLLIFRP